MTSNVKVSDRTASFIDGLVENGSFPSREAAVEAGVQRLHDEQEWLRMLDAKVVESRAEFAVGKGRPADQVFDELDARYRNWPR